MGLLAANDSFPGTAWTLVVDDDNMLRPAEVAGYLAHFDPDVPFFLAGRLGPSRARKNDSLALSAPLSLPPSAPLELLEGGRKRESERERKRERKKTHTHTHTLLTLVFAP